MPASGAASPELVGICPLLGRTVCHICAGQGPLDHPQWHHKCRWPRSQGCYRSPPHRLGSDRSPSGLENCHWSWFLLPQLLSRWRGAHCCPHPRSVTGLQSCDTSSRGTQLPAPCADQCQLQPKVQGLPWIVQGVAVWSIATRFPPGEAQVWRVQGHFPLSGALQPRLVDSWSDATFSNWP